MYSFVHHAPWDVFRFHSKRRQKNLRTFCLKYWPNISSATGSLWSEFVEGSFDRCGWMTHGTLPGFPRSIVALYCSYLGLWFKLVLFTIDWATLCSSKCIINPFTTSHVCPRYQMFNNINGILMDLTVGFVRWMRQVLCACRWHLSYMCNGVRKDIIAGNTLILVLTA